MLIFLTALNTIMLGLVGFILYYSFLLPERERREAFKKLTADEVEELRNTMTADHFFRLKADQKLPSLKLRLTKKIKVS